MLASFLRRPIQAHPDQISVDDKARFASNRNKQFPLPRAATPDNYATHFSLSRTSRIVRFEKYPPMMPAYNTIHGRSATFSRYHAYVLAVAKNLTVDRPPFNGVYSRAVLSRELDPIISSTVAFFRNHLGKWGIDDRRGPRLDITTRIREDSSCFFGRRFAGLRYR